MGIMDNDRRGPDSAEPGTCYSAAWSRVCIDRRRADPCIERESTATTALNIQWSASVQSRRMRNVAEGERSSESILSLL